MKKSNLILLFTFLFSALGILSFILVPYHKPLFNIRFFHQLSALISPLDLNIFNSYGKWYYKAINLFFIAVLVVGGIIYATNRNKTRLIRFVFSVIFLSAMADLISIILRLSFPYPGIVRGPSVFDTVMAFISIIFMIGCSLYVLKLLHQQRKPQPTLPEDQTSDKWMKSSQGDRFVHFLVDDVMSLLTISKIAIVFMYTSSKAQMMLDIMGNPGKFTLVLLVFRIIYYVLSESFLQSTPGKFLTESRVVNQNGERPGFLRILLRTLCRFIPFDNFSYLIQANWHDRLSKTIVVKEVRSEE